jgi:hypothetical protein|tara:strand:+ start:30 stop:293 length:264 start_codon:yes stop_codon:yes gene_type:complete
MNSKEFVKQVFELTWQAGASVEHYKNGLSDLPGRENNYTYEATLKKLTMGIDCLKKYNHHYDEAVMKSFNSLDSTKKDNIYGYPIDD